MKDPGLNIAHLKEKNLGHFDVNLTVHCRSLFAFTARKVLWAAELRPADVKDPNFTSSVNNSGQLEFLQQQTGFGALECLQSSSINFLVNSFIKHFCLSLCHGGIEAELLLRVASLATTPAIPTGPSYHTAEFCHSAGTPLLQCHLLKGK